MVDKEKIEQLVHEKLDKGMYLVEVSVNASNNIRVYIDSYEGITIEQCVAISRHLESNLDREQEDFELQVSSPGLSEAFRVREQYLKNVGRHVEVETKDGSKLEGLLKAASPDNILLETSSLEKTDGQKKKQLIVKEHKIDYSDIESTKVVVLFK